MTSEQWEEATEVDFVAAPQAERIADTEPAPPPSEPPPAASSGAPLVICEICDGYGEHDAACPRSKAIAP